MKEIKYDKYYWQNAKIRLRPMLPEDWEESYYNMFDSEARRKLQYQIELPTSLELEQEGVNKFVNFNTETNRYMFTIETLDGTNVGALNLNSIDERNGTFSIGMQVGRDYRGKGYGTAAMRILLRYAFFERRLNKYYGSVLETNIASPTMLKKVGCVQEGVQRQMVYTDGRYHDIILYGLTKEEFIENEKKFQDLSLRKE
ncbi:MAG: GNAT family N-acetyltransferase [Firmicutes bacterium]|nr:GNAT family N-acetyltransferase [Bacillota bacterium]